MLIKRSTLDEIRRGGVTLLFRRRDRVAARVGSTYRTAVGLISIDAVDEVVLGTITVRDARSAGYGSLASLLDELDRWPGASVFRIQVRYAGADPRTALRDHDQLAADELRGVFERLARFDRADASGGWTVRYLTLIQDRPGVLAAHLAASVKQPTVTFKRRVRQLKELGLTESLVVGYRLSPRGRAVLGGTAPHD
ncbi:MAG TPA: hypothetical protein VI733_01020 [Candidatus Limnocylindria bacterium]|nr:hypothetical protein [Candidatus Limnocylindria bacterium]